MDNLAKADWRKGFIFFCIIGLGVMLLQELPTGYSLLDVFLSIFGLTSRWVRNGSTIFVGNLVIAVGIIVCIVFAAHYWREYRVRFVALPQILRKLPLIVVAFVILTGNFVINPSVIDRMYFSYIARQGGIEAVTMGNERSLRITTQEGATTYTYSFWLTNHGRDILVIEIYLVYEVFDRESGTRSMSQTPIIWDDGANVKWNFGSRFPVWIYGSFEVSAKFRNGSNSHHHGFSVIIVDEYGNEFSPPILTRH